MHDLAVQDGRQAGEILGSANTTPFDPQRSRTSSDGSPRCIRFRGSGRAWASGSNVLNAFHARYQPAGAGLDISNSSKTVEFWLKNPIQMLEGRIETC
jgi:hypothetical protein